MSGRAAVNVKRKCAMPGVKEAAKLRRVEKLALREEESEETRRDEGERRV